ncbi:hypothetical protein Chor_015141, partial [Crotalus horridus]
MWPQEFQAQCTKDQLLARFGEHLVRLSTANTYSYHKETLYFFGDNNFTEWGSLLKKYNPPPFGIPGTTGAYSFGIAGSGSGVPFHWHGPGFSEHWFLYPPEKTPAFHPNKTTLSWFLDTYPSLPPWEKPVECTIHPGEAGSLFSGPLVARDPQPGHQRFHLDLPGLAAPPDTSCMMGLSPSFL